jgi:hypothetical protein
MAADAPRTCPSARAEAGNLLYGRVRDGHVERMGTALPVDQAFIDHVAANGPAEQRFRFAGRCIEGGCGQWENGGCSVIERVLQGRAAAAEGLPRCFIRASCRWFAQRGGAACAVCPEVVTDRRVPVSPPPVSQP